MSLHLLILFWFVVHSSISQVFFCFQSHIKSEKSCTYIRLITQITMVISFNAHKKHFLDFHMFRIVLLFFSLSKLRQLYRQGIIERESCTHCAILCSFSTVNDQLLRTEKYDAFCVIFLLTSQKCQRSLYWEGTHAHQVHF